MGEFLPWACLIGWILIPIAYFYGRESASKKNKPKKRTDTQIHIAYLKEIEIGGLFERLTSLFHFAGKTQLLFDEKKARYIYPDNYVFHFADGFFDYDQSKSNLERKLDMIAEIMVNLQKLGILSDTEIEEKYYRESMNFRNND